MKNTLLKISILLNLGLLGGLICLLVAGRKHVPEASPVAVVETKSSGNEAVATVATTTQLAAQKPFCWSQLDSPDYHVYVQNLRNIGCPEPTIRAIVTADVHAAYQSRSEAVVKQLSALAGSSWATRLAAGDSEATLRSELQQLPNLEAAQIADFIGLSVLSSSTRQSAADANNTAEPVSLPLVFKNVDLAALKLNEDQIQVITDLRQSFINDIGGAQQNPDDPDYLARWQIAKPNTDALLVGMLGMSTFQNFKAAAGKISQ